MYCKSLYRLPQFTKYTAKKLETKKLSIYQKMISEKYTPGCYMEVPQLFPA